MLFLQSQLTQRKASLIFSFCEFLPDAMGSYLDVGGVEVHVVHPPAGRVDPAGAQAILQCLKGYVQADHQVQLADPVQRLGLPQCPRETCAGTATERGCEERQESSRDGGKTTRPTAPELQNHGGSSL